MTADEGENSGLQGAHTLAGKKSGAVDRGQVEPDADRAAKVGTVRAMAEAALGDLARQLVAEPEPEQQSLMLDEIDEQQALFRGPVRHVADKIEASRRGPGRPKGSQNKASQEFRDVLMRMGYRHPGFNLAALANADPAALALELAGLPCDPERDALAQIAEAIAAGKLKRADVAGLMSNAHGLVLKANAELMPFFESKAPTKVDVAKKAVLGVMVIGDMAQPESTERKTIDLTKFDAP